MTADQPPSPEREPREHGPPQAAEQWRCPCCGREGTLSMGSLGLTRAGVLAPLTSEDELPCSVRLEFHVQTSGARDPSSDPPMAAHPAAFNDREAVNSMSAATDSRQGKRRPSTERIQPTVKVQWSSRPIIPGMSPEGVVKAIRRGVGRSGYFGSKRTQVALRRALEAVRPIATTHRGNKAAKGSSTKNARTI